MANVIDIGKTPEFEEWYASLGEKQQFQIEARLERISVAHHFGDAKSLSDGLAELRWKNGWRIYFAKTSATQLVVLLGGSKNAQEKDIKRAKILLRRYAHNTSQERRP